MTEGAKTTRIVPLDSTDEWTDGNPREVLATMVRKGKRRAVRWANDIHVIHQPIHVSDDPDVAREAAALNARHEEIFGNGR